MTDKNTAALAAPNTDRELLELADDLESEFAQGRISNHTGRKAATELRRQHAENETLRAERERNLNSIRVCNEIINKKNAELESLRTGYDAARLEIESLRARSVASAGAQQPDAAYAALPEPDLVSKQRDSTMRYTTVRSFSESQMRAFADATCAIRASHGQAPAQPAPQPVAREPLSDEQYNILVEDLSEWGRHVEDIAPQSLEEHIRQVFAIHGIKGGQHGTE